ncbi:hypothetical protein B0T16DRAFT_462676 [Cercophora newfieldiana]|uniref:Uncharacterized protein n=1 Tax=Cercophora newfieldiana TaxID=92897 RepID=A0AA40CHF6_9PEZI|nr:hypothetical protein B0T16DRAFT_462676 [Cercophora newfieldiana]
MQRPLVVNGSSEPRRSPAASSSSRPGYEPIEDYITQTRERCRLFYTFQNYGFWTRNPPSIRPLNASVLAFFLVAPVDRIKAVVDHCLFNGGLPTTWRNGYNQYCSRAIEAYFPPWSDNRTPTAAEVEQSPPRNDETTSPDSISPPDFVFPPTLVNSCNIHSPNLQAVQYIFWGEKSHAWCPAYLDSAAKVTLVFEQMGIPPPTPTRMNPKLRLALKPLRRTQRGVMVQEHWLRKTPLTPLMPIEGEGDILAQAGLSDFRSWGKADPEREAELGGNSADMNGRVFEVPGASFEVLEMHWNMMRVAAICGALDWVAPGINEETQVAAQVATQPEARAE